MDSYTISDELLTKISGQKVTAAVFTTYTFEPDFFEIDVVPLLLDQEQSFSTDERIKTLQVRESLRESGLEIDVFYDLNVGRQNIEHSPAMEYLCHGVNIGGSAFHAKNTYLLVEDPEGNHHLLMCAGSNNLSRSGWWENIEVAHWIVISSDSDSSVIADVISDVEWLISHTSTTGSTALTSIQRYLAQANITKSDGFPIYMGMQRQSSVFDFFEQHLRTEFLIGDVCHLEIISPFFADSPDNRLHDEFMEKLPIQDITILLPADQEKTALCEQDYFEAIHQANNIQWGQWQPNIGKQIGLSSDLFRRLHAKVYHFYTDTQSWLFIGSVNFSHKAFGYHVNKANVESGFLIKLDYVQPLLTPLVSNQAPIRFQPPKHDQSAAIDDELLLSIPEIHLCYDWRTNELSGRCSEDNHLKIQIINHEQQAVTTPWLLTSETNYYQHDDQALDSLRELLKNGSLVTVVGIELSGNTDFPQHTVMLQQVGWSHKPIELPNLTTEQIIAIYAGMSPERRLMLVKNAQIKKLLIENLAGELNSYDSDLVADSFFCEYAEIFHAFKVFKKRLLAELESGNEIQLDYYLTGQGLDSLPILCVNAVDDSDDDWSAVTSYLLLLLINEIYQDPDFIDRLNVKIQTAAIVALINDIKAKIILDGRTELQRQSFFIWFEQQFYTQYSTNTLEDAV